MTKQNARKIITLPFFQVEIEGIHCECGNNAVGDGFYPCDNLGNTIEPLAKEWKGLYVCANCNQVYKMDFTK